MVKNMPTSVGDERDKETQVRSLGQEDPLEEGVATHSRILAWRIPWRSLEGYSPSGHKELDMIEAT